MEKKERTAHGTRPSADEIIVALRQEFLLLVSQQGMFRERERKWTKIRTIGSIRQLLNQNLIYYRDKYRIAIGLWK